jgi:hypothetical protein
MQCKYCKSDNTQSLSVIYQSGTQDINTSSNAFGTVYSSGGIGFGSATITTKGTAQSYLASRAAPPKRKSFNTTIVFTILWLIGFMYAALSFVLFLPFLAIAIFSWRKASNFNDKVYPALREKWLHSWHCNKCGSIYSDDEMNIFQLNK